MAAVSLALPLQHSKTLALTAHHASIILSSFACDVFACPCLLFPLLRLFSSICVSGVRTFLRGANGLLSTSATSTLSSPVTSTEFGTAVAVNAAGSTLAVGAPAELDAGGAIYIYTGAAGTGAWDAPQKLSGSDFDFAPTSHFGQVLSLNSAGDTLAVAAPMYAASQGSARVFFLSAGVWSAQSAILTPALIYGRVGSALALNAAGDRLAVGAYLDIEQGVFNGAVYLFKRDGGGVWSLAQKVMPSDSVTDIGRYFGTSLALSASGNTLVVGATMEATTGAWWSGTGRTSTHSGKLRSRSVEKLTSRLLCPALSSLSFFCQAL
jgi:hypothetical protein